MAYPPPPLPRAAKGLGVVPDPASSSGAGAGAATERGAPNLEGLCSRVGDRVQAKFGESRLKYVLSKSSHMSQPPLSTLRRLRLFNLFFLSHLLRLHPPLSPLLKNSKNLYEKHFFVFNRRPARDPRVQPRPQVHERALPSRWRQTRGRGQQAFRQG